MNQHKIEPQGFKSILITGGTGSFGSAFVEYALMSQQYERVIIFSRDELKQYELKERFNHDPRLRFFIGDIRDKDRLKRAFYGVDVVIHAAALKQVDTAEYNPHEFIKTNILGSQNVIDASLDEGVRRVVALSTDKASSPINLYGATKLTADKIFLSANIYAGNRPITYSVVRYGNVSNSRGSLIPKLVNQFKTNQTFNLTNPQMTRFWLTLEESVKMVAEVIQIGRGGDLFVPRIPSIFVKDVLDAFGSSYPRIEVGIRPGEKLHEEMISQEESRRTFEYEKYYVIESEILRNYERDCELVNFSGKSLNSLDNPMFLNVQQIQEYIMTKYPDLELPQP